MPVYRYTAKNQQGGTVTGLVEAEDTRRAAESCGRWAYCC